VRFRVHSSGVAVHSSEPALGKNAIYAMADVVTRLRAIAQSLTEVIDPHPLCGSASLSVGRIEGGTSVNIVPAHCEIEIDRRIIPGEDPQAVYHSLVSELKSVGQDIVCDEPWVSSPALGDQDNARLARAVLMHVNKITAGKQSVGVPYCTHASTISAAGVPSIVFGPGSITQAHTKDEFIEMESLDAAAEVYFGICTDDSCWEG
jgi:succinyl-diaminopimelate desuccinylase